MSSIEERLTKIERELETIRASLTGGRRMPIAQISDKYRDDEVLKEIFRLGKEIRDAECDQDGQDME